MNVDESSELFIDQEYKVYPRRWLMLFLFSLLSFSNAMAWISFAPIARTWILTPPPPSILMSFNVVILYSLCVQELQAGFIWCILFGFTLCQWFTWVCTLWEFG